MHIKIHMKNVCVQDVLIDFFSSQYHHQYYLQHHHHHDPNIINNIISSLSSISLNHLNNNAILIININANANIVNNHK